MKDGEVIDRIVRGEKPADSLVMGGNQIAAQAINISSSPAPAGDRIPSSTPGYGTKADNKFSARNVRFSNRPLRVKRFQAIHHSGVNVARGLSLLFGLGTKALPSWDSKTRWNNLLGDLAVNVTAGSSEHTNSPHPSSREGHHSTVWADFRFSRI